MIDLSPVVLTVTPLVTSEAQTYASVERITEVAINPIPTPFLVVHSPLKYLTILIASSDSSVLGVCPFVVVMRLPAPFEFLHLPHCQSTQRSTTQSRKEAIEGGLLPDSI